MRGKPRHLCSFALFYALTHPKINYKITLFLSSIFFFFIFFHGGVQKRMMKFTCFSRHCARRMRKAVMVLRTASNSSGHLLELSSRSTTSRGSTYKKNAVHVYYAKIRAGKSRRGSYLEGALLHLLNNKMQHKKATTKNECSLTHDTHLGSYLRGL